MISATNVDDAKFFYAKTSYVPTLGFNGIKQTDRAGNIQVMVGLDFWTPNSVQIHIYIANPKHLTRKFIREVFNYIFVTCQRGLVVGITPSDNAAALELNRRIGFKQTYRVVDGWISGVDMVLQEMRVNDCKWLRRH